MEYYVTNADTVFDCEGTFVSTPTLSRLPTLPIPTPTPSPLDQATQYTCKEVQGGNGSIAFIIGKN